MELDNYEHDDLVLAMDSQKVIFGKARAGQHWWCWEAVDRLFEKLESGGSTIKRIDVYRHRKPTVH